MLGTAKKRVAENRPRPPLGEPFSIGAWERSSESAARCDNPKDHPARPLAPQCLALRVATASIERQAQGGSIEQQSTRSSKPSPLALHS